MNSMFRLAAVIVGYVLLSLPILGQQVLTPLRVEDLLETQSFSTRAPIDLSPDGQWVAYTTENQGRRTETVTDNRYFYYNRQGVPLEAVGSTVWITNTTSGASRRLMDGAATSWGAAWSPDARFLAFYSDRNGSAQLWVWERETNRLRPGSSAIVRPFFQFEIPQWTPDSKKILVKVLPEGLNLDAAANLLANAYNPQPAVKIEEVPTVLVYESLPNQTTRDETLRPTDTVKNWFLADLALVDVLDGSVQRLVTKKTPIGYSISPDGSFAAVSSYNGVESKGSGEVTFDLILVPIATRVPRILVQNVPMRYGTSLSWSPNSKMLSYFTSGLRLKGDCYVVLIDGVSPQNLTSGVASNVGTTYDVPLWDADGKTILAIGGDALWELPIDGRKPVKLLKESGKSLLNIVAQSTKSQICSPVDKSSVYFSARDSKTKRVGFYKVNRVSGSVTALTEEDKAYGSPPRFSIDTSDDGRKIAYVAQDSQHSPDIWMAEPDFRSSQRVTRINPNLDRYIMGKSRLIEWQTADGKKLQGSLLLPAGYKPGNRYPMVVEVYGGAMGSDFLNLFGLTGNRVRNDQLLATRGYAVFSPDIPLQFGAPMRSIAEAVLSGVDKIVELGIADPDRLGVTGQSNGGYCTLALIVQTTRFKAAVSRSGFGNLFGYYGVMKESGTSNAITWAETGQGNLGTTPWADRQKYIDNSPTFFLDRVTTPLLMVHGSMDDTVPPFLADEIFVGLRRLGREVVYAKYLGGDHFEPNFSLANARDYAQRFVGWFDKYLKTPAMAAKPVQ